MRRIFGAKGYAVCILKKGSGMRVIHGGKHT